MKKTATEGDPSSGTSGNSFTRFRVVVLAFYVDDFVQAGNWEYYFGGSWTHGSPPRSCTGLFWDASWNCLASISGRLSTRGGGGGDVVLGAALCLVLFWVA